MDLLKRAADLIHRQNAVTYEFVVQLRDYWTTHYDELVSISVTSHDVTLSDLYFMTLCECLGILASPDLLTLNSMAFPPAYISLWPPKCDKTFEELSMEDIDTMVSTICQTVPQTLLFSPDFYNIVELLMMVMGKTAFKDLPTCRWVQDKATVFYQLTSMCLMALQFDVRKTVERPPDEVIAQLQTFFKREATKEPIVEKRLERLALGIIGSKLHLGEYLIYVRQFPKQDIDINTIYEHFRGNEAWRTLFQRLNKSNLDLAMSDDYHTSSFCKIQLLDMYLERYYSVNFISDYVLAVDQLHNQTIDLLKQRSTPMLIMDFNRFNVYYDGVLYECGNRFEWAIWFFFKACNNKLKGVSIVF
jgi:hypothetical protein